MWFVLFSRPNIALLLCSQPFHTPSFGDEGFEIHNMISSTPLVGQPEMNLQNSHTYQQQPSQNHQVRFQIETLVRAHIFTHAALRHQPLEFSWVCFILFVVSCKHLGIHYQLCLDSIYSAAEISIMSYLDHSDNLSETYQLEKRFLRISCVWHSLSIYHSAPSPYLFVIYLNEDKMLISCQFLGEILHSWHFVCEYFE